MAHKFFEDTDKNKEFLKYLDNRFESFGISLKTEIEANLKIKSNEKLLEHLLEDLGDLKTLEYYLDKDLYNISMSALKDAMQKKAFPYVPL